ncbi:hypothetical protein TIFTF001_028263 [Ficus carica]|uniref:Rx N-terminal domain-containing protein n=1 Tax=Ficus carica TaxID=3494 RepID=A0AA88DPP5_FICCA|nr:hypothetical protein TIFTF001_028263 [Ficus carica]
MAAEMVGGALLSSFLNVLFDRLATKEVVDLFQGKKVIANLLAELKIRLLSANSLLNDAEEKQFTDPNVKNWIEELKEVLYKADHVMDKINTKALRRKVKEGESGSKVSKIFMSLPKLYSVFDNTVKFEIQEILDRLKLLLDQNNSLGLKEGVRGKQLQLGSHAPLQSSKNGESILHMHDLVHDLAIRTSALPLSIVSLYKPTLMPKNLQEKLQRGGDFLRVLSLSQSSIMELPDSIGNLKHLRLINLRHLVITDTALKQMPPHICNLTNLQTLSNFILGENSVSRIKELGALPHLHGSLCISGLKNVVDVGDVLEADLKNKECLTELVLQWNGGETNDTLKEREVLNALEPHRKLKKLIIEGYRGTIFPDWVANQSFGDMVEVRLRDCRNCCLLPPFGQLPSLRELEIRGMYVSSIENECFGASLTMLFPSLERLSMSDMSVLERWPTGANQEVGLFPRLKHIHLRSCNKLNVGLPAGCLSSLKSIEIWNCNTMVGVVPASQEIGNAFPSLESIDLRLCDNLESFSEMGLPSNLKRLEIVICEKLMANRKNWNLQRLSNLQTLRLRGCEELLVNSFPEEGLLPSALTNFMIASFSNLKALNGKGFQHLTSLQKLAIIECRRLESLPEEGLPLSLSTLRIVGCPLLSERCERETGEDWPKIQHIPTAEIGGK